MPEPLEHSAVALDPTSDAAWQEFAPQVPDLHPAVRPHAEHHLAIRRIAQAGMQAQAEQSGGDAAAGDEGTGTPESKRPGASLEQIADAFASAQNNVYKLSADPTLHKYLSEHKIDPYDDIATPQYWHAVADFGRGRINRMREQYGDNVKLRAFELMVTTPEYLFAQKALKNPAHRYTPEGEQDLQTTIAFNEQLRDFATTHPELRANKANAMMLTMVSMAIEDKPVRQAAAQIATGAIRGAQYELGFGQLLEAAGRKFRKGTREEDGKGIDYVVQGSGGRELHVDSKASLTEVNNRGSEGAYAIKPGGKIVMYAMLQDHDFGGRFFVPPSLAVERGEALSQQIDMAEHDLLKAA
jgi:hypothetical protein